MTVGIICSCLPVTGPIFREHNFGSFSTPFAKLQSPMSFKNTFHRMKAKRQAGSDEVLLETGILENGSATFGNGKFLKTMNENCWNTTCSSSTGRSGGGGDDDRG